MLRVDFQPTPERANHFIAGLFVPIARTTGRSYSKFSRVDAIGRGTEMTVWYTQAHTSGGEDRNARTGNPWGSKSSAGHALLRGEKLPLVLVRCQCQLIGHGRLTPRAADDLSLSESIMRSFIDGDQRQNGTFVRTKWFEWIFESCERIIRVLRYAVGCESVEINIQFERNPISNMPINLSKLNASPCESITYCNQWDYYL